MKVLLELSYYNVKCSRKLEPKYSINSGLVDPSPSEGIKGDMREKILKMDV